GFLAAARVACTERVGACAFPVSMLHACITGGSSAWTYGLPPPFTHAACCDWHSRTHSRSASVVVGGGVGSVTPQPAIPAAKRAGAKTLDQRTRSEARRLTIVWVNASLGAPGDDELAFDAHASSAHVVPFQREVGSGSGGELAAAHAPTG